MLEDFLLCTIGSIADLIRVGIEVLEGSSTSEVALGIFMRGIAVTYPIQVLREVKRGMGK